MAEIFVCSNCGKQTAKWLGQCPQCQAWNTLTLQTSFPEGTRRGGKAAPAATVTFAELEKTQTLGYRSLGSAEFNRVLGGGVVPGQVVLFAGEPGVGKSTFLLYQLAQLAQENIKVAYVAGEESPGQVAQRLQRLLEHQTWDQSRINENMVFIGETDIQRVLAALDQAKPALVIVDSVQSMQVAAVASVPGSVAQVRNVGQLVTDWSKQTNTTTFLVGQITKSGTIAGPKLLEHMVDTVLYMEKVGIEDTRLLRTMKNRYGSTLELGFFGMTERGVEDKADVETLFAHHDQVRAPGSSLGITLQGNRPLLIEIQALVLEPQYQTVRRVVEGVSKSRVELILAVIARYVPSTYIAQKDVFVKVTGGLQLKDPGIDLAIATAIFSSVRNQEQAAGTAYVGELSLLGDVLPCTGLGLRLQEAKRLKLDQVVTGRVAGKSKSSAHQKEVSRIDDLYSTRK